MRLPPTGKALPLAVMAAFTVALPVAVIARFPAFDDVEVFASAVIAAFARKSPEAVIEDVSAAPTPALPKVILPVLRKSRPAVIFIAPPVPTAVPAVVSVLPIETSLAAVKVDVVLPLRVTAALV